jgi:hypothetical protein
MRISIECIEICGVDGIWTSNDAITATDDGGKEGKTGQYDAKMCAMRWLPDVTRERIRPESQRNMGRWQWESRSATRLPKHECMACSKDFTSALSSLATSPSTSSLTSHHYGSALVNISDYQCQRGPFPGSRGFTNTGHSPQESPDCDLGIACGHVSGSLYISLTPVRICWGTILMWRRP